MVGRSISSSSAHEVDPPWDAKAKAAFFDIFILFLFTGDRLMKRKDVTVQYANYSLR
jgi:hypothetical protein